MKYQRVFWIPYVKRVYRLLGPTTLSNVNLVPRNSKIEKHLDSRLRYGRQSFCGAEKSHKPRYLCSERRIRSHLKQALPKIPSLRTPLIRRITRRLPFKKPKLLPVFGRRQALLTHRDRAPVRIRPHRRSKTIYDYCDRTLLDSIADYVKGLPPKRIRQFIWRMRPRVSFFVPGGYHGTGEYECRTFYRDAHPFRYSRLKYCPALDKGGNFISTEQWDHLVLHEEAIVERYNRRRNFLLAQHSPGTPGTTTIVRHSTHSNPFYRKFEDAMSKCALVEQLRRNVDVYPDLDRDPEIPDDVFNDGVCDMSGERGPDEGILPRQPKKRRVKNKGLRPLVGEAGMNEWVRLFELTGVFRPTIADYEKVDIKKVV